MSSREARASLVAALARMERRDGALRLLRAAAGDDVDAAIAAIAFIPALPLDVLARAGSESDSARRDSLLDESHVDRCGEPAMSVGCGAGSGIIPAWKVPSIETLPPLLLRIMTDHALRSAARWQRP